MHHHDETAGRGESAPTGGRTLWWRRCCRLAGDTPPTPNLMAATNGQGEHSAGERGLRCACLWRRHHTGAWLFLVYRAEWP